MASAPQYAPSGLTILPVQSRMARAALGWGVRDLARKAGVSPDTVARFERGDELRPATLATLRAALEAAGAVFTFRGGPGVTLAGRSGVFRHGKRTPLEG
jgi:transcriptional regulator with XRE-family HTH domain